VLGVGAVPTLEKLLLSSNDIGDDGALTLTLTPTLTLTLALT